MKSAINTAITVVRRSAAWFAMRELERSLSDTVDTLTMVSDTETRLAIQISIRRLRRELSKARAHYNSFSNPGVVRIWDLA